MKKIGTFALYLISLYWLYFLATTLLLLILQTVMRLFIPGESWGELLWKTIVFYIMMTVVSAGHLKITGAEQKRVYLSLSEERPWSLRTSLRFTLKNADFWLRTPAFAVWPVIVPSFFGSVKSLFFSQAVLARLPDRVWMILTFDLPFLLMHLCAWLLVTRLWHMGRLRG